MERLFFALWPSEAVRLQIDTINQGISIYGVRKLKSRNLHVTLRYLGEIDSDIQHAIIQKVSCLKSSTFSFQLDALHFWPEPKIICLTASEHPPAMLALVDQLTEIVRPYQVHIHDRPYQAHVTLMRKAKADYPMTIKPIRWLAESFVLVESRSTSQGIQYDVLQRWGLA